MARGRNRYQRRGLVPRGRVQVAQVPPQPARQDLVLEEEHESFEITDADLMNVFYVKVTYPAFDETQSDEIVPVIGRQTVQILAEKVAVKLWEKAKVLHPQCQVELFENGRLVAPATVLAEVLKITRRERRGDGLTVTFDCFVTGLWGGSFFD